MRYTISREANFSPFLINGRGPAQKQTVTVGQLNPTSQELPKPQRELQHEFRSTAETQPSHQGLMYHCESQSSSTTGLGFSYEESSD